MNLKTIVILKICLLLSLGAHAYEVDIALNGQLKKGNTEFTEYGGKTSFTNDTFEFKVLTEFYKYNQDIYRKYQGSTSYLYDIPGKGWDVFAWAQVTQDDKKGIDLATKESIGGIYKFNKYMSYSLGIGHRRLNLKNDPILSHRLKIKYGNSKFGTGFIIWMWNGQDFMEYLSELKLNIKLFDNLRFGFAIAYQYDSLPLAGKLKADLTTKFEIALNWNID